MPSRRTASPAAGRVALVAVAVAALAACTPSKIDAAADVAVRGRLLHQAGSRPASGRTVYLTRDLGPSDLLPGVLTAGLACLSDDKPEVCRSGVRHDLTESDGRFAFDLKGRDTQTVFGNTRHFNLAAEVSPPPGHVDGAGVTGGFVIQTEKLDLPDLRLWEPATTFGSTGGQGTASWDGLPTSGYGKLRQYDVVFTDAAGDAVWSLPSTTPSLSFDLRLLEDSRGVAAVHARATAPAPSTPLDLDYRAPTTAYASAAGAPVSRGVPCTIGPPGGLVVTPCPLTDANFSATLGGAVRHPSPGPVPTGGSAANAPRPVPSSAIVDTNEVRGMTLVVVRGCAADCVVDVSANGTGWATLATVRGDAAIHPEGGTAVARYVRVSVATGDLAALREVSVWDQSVDPRAGTGLAQPGTRLLPSRSGRSGPTRVAWWLVAMAVALLLATSSATIVRLLTFRPLWKAFSGD